MDNGIPIEVAEELYNACAEATKWLWGYAPDAKSLEEVEEQLRSAMAKYAPYRNLNTRTTAVSQH